MDNLQSTDGAECPSGAAWLRNPIHWLHPSRALGARDDWVRLWGPGRGIESHFQTQLVPLPSLARRAPISWKPFASHNGQFLARWPLAFLRPPAAASSARVSPGLLGVLPAGQRIVLLRGIDHGIHQCIFPSILEELRQERVAAINNVDHEPFHLLIAQS